MATDWSARDGALPYFENMLKYAKRMNDDDKEFVEAAVHALRRSQDHTAIQTRLNGTVAALREAREYILDNGDERTMAPIIERIDDALGRTDTRPAPRT